MFSATDIVTGYVSALKKIKDQTNGTVGYLFDSDVDGVTFSGLLKPLLEEAGFTVYDPGRFSVDTTDFTSIIADLQSHDCDIVVGNQILPNFMTAWKQFNEKNYIPKAFILGKGLCYGTDFMALDPLPDGIMCEIEFAKSFPYHSDLLDMTPADLANKWEDEMKTQFPVCSFGYDVVFWEVLNEALKNCKDLQPETIKNAIAAVDIDTIYGHIVFSECDGHVAKCPIVCGQWFPSKEWDNTYDFNIVGQGNFPDIPDTDPYIIPNTTQD
jgi:branched-chain amino acid transport system substrate-binding protein